MGTRKAQRPQGFAILDPRWNDSNLRANDAVLGNSDYTEQGPRPGQFLASDDLSEGLLAISNAQTTAVELRAVQGGRAQRGAATWAYRRPSPSASDRPRSR